MKRSEFVFRLQQELQKHHFDTFVDELPSVADGGHGVVAPGCTLCRKRINTTTAFLDHLLLEILPEAVEDSRNHGQAPREAFVIQLEEARAEYGRRHLTGPCLTVEDHADAEELLRKAVNAGIKAELVSSGK